MSKITVKEWLSGLTIDSEVVFTNKDGRMVMQLRGWKYLTDLLQDAQAAKFQDKVAATIITAIENHLMPSEGLSCPFCKENADFDTIGLKYHLRHYCEEYTNTENI